MVADESRRGVAHLVFVKREWVVQDITPQHRRHHFAPIQTITVDFAARRPARAEVRPRLLCADNAYGGRKYGVQRPLKFLWRKPGLRAKTSHLTECMYASIRSTGGMKRNVFLRQSSENADDLTLHRRFTRLNLPAVKIRSVVGHRKLDIAHAK